MLKYKPVSITSFDLNLLLYQKYLWYLQVKTKSLKDFKVWKWHTLFSTNSVVLLFMEEQCFLDVERNIQIWVLGVLSR